MQFKLDFSPEDTINHLQYLDDIRTLERDLSRLMATKGLFKPFQELIKENLKLLKMIEESTVNSSDYSIKIPDRCSSMITIDRRELPNFDMLDMWVTKVSQEYIDELNRNSDYGYGGILFLKEETNPDTLIIISLDKMSGDYLGDENKKRIRLLEDTLKSIEDSIRDHKDYLFTVEVEIDGGRMLKLSNKFLDPSLSSILRQEEACKSTFGCRDYVWTRRIINSDCIFKLIDKYDDTSFRNAVYRNIKKVTITNWGYWSSDTSRNYTPTPIPNHLIHVKGGIEPPRYSDNRTIDIPSLFAGCRFKKLDLSDWDVSNQKTFSRWFKSASVEYLNIENWDTSGVEDISEIFKGAKIHKYSLPLKWDVTNLKTAKEMFADSRVPYSFELDPFVQGKYIDIYNIFNNSQLDWEWAKTYRDKYEDKFPRLFINTLVVNTDEVKPFRGDRFFLSNIYPVRIKTIKSFTPSLEHLYQYTKIMTLDEIDESLFFGLTASKSIKELKKYTNTRMNKSIKDMGDKSFEEFKDIIMISLLVSKFTIPHLRDKIIATDPSSLCEKNSWGDMNWGVTESGVGNNRLGRLLFIVRKILIRVGEEYSTLIMNIVDEIKLMGFSPSNINDNSVLCATLKYLYHPAFTRKKIHAWTMPGDIVNIGESVYYESNEDTFILHLCNIRNIMGAGVAKRLVERYPFINTDTPKEYGSSIVVKVKENTKSSLNVVNLYGMKDIGSVNEGETVFDRYTAFNDALVEFMMCIDNEDRKDTRVNFIVPRIGAGRAGLDLSMMIRILEHQIKLTQFICVNLIHV